MYTVVVADDEEELRNMLVRRVDWESVGFQVVGEASNGVEALELVEKLSPDLLLTDISMPFVSGIELARQVREIRPTMQIAFLSGYDDFTYAQQAITYNIISYMLKPISVEEIIGELTKIKGIIDAKFEEFSSTRQAQANVDKAEFLLPLLLEHMHIGPEMSAKIVDEELIAGAISCDFIKEGNALNMKYAVMVTEFIDEDGKHCTTKSSINAVDTILEKYLHYSSFYISGKIVSVLSATNRGFEKYLHILSEELVQSARRILNQDCQIGISRVMDSLASAHECYIEAVNAISYKTIKGEQENVHYISDKERNHQVDQERVENFIKELETLLRGGSNDEIKEYITQIFGELDQSEMPMEMANYIAVQMISTIFKVVYAVAGNEAITELQNNSPMQNITIFYDRQDAFNKYMKLCASARGIIRDQLKNSSDVLCHQALAIINEDYADANLSLVSVSNRIAVSPNYLSALLKRYTGNTFVEHLTNKRIEVANELLLCTQMKIREIAEKCGYNDQHYFSYCFKKITGESPNNLRRMNEEARQV